MSDPLFIADRATLASQLRLSGRASDSDVDEILTSAILAANLSFRRELTAARIATLLATAFTAAPTTDAQVLRGVANRTEMLIAKEQILRDLPTLFMDASANVDEVWNEAPIRRGAPRIEVELEELRMEIQENFELLSGEDPLREESRVRAYSIGPAEGTVPGDGIRWQ